MKQNKTYLIAYMLLLLSIFILTVYMFAPKKPKQIYIDLPEEINLADSTDNFKCHLSNDTLFVEFDTIN